MGGVKIGNNLFVSISELSIDNSNPPIKTTNFEKLLEIHDRHIFDNFHKNEASYGEDAPELLGINENE